MSGYRPMTLADLAGLLAQRERADALVRATAAFREHGVPVSKGPGSGVKRRGDAGVRNG
jgi:hypothetical protein